MPTSPTRARPIQPPSPLKGQHASRPSSVLREKGTSRSPSRPRPSSPKKLGHRGGGEREKVLCLLRRTGRQTPEMPDFVHGRLKHYGPGKVVEIYDNLNHTLQRVRASFGVQLCHLVDTVVDRPGSLLPNWRIGRTYSRIR